MFGHSVPIVGSYGEDVFNDFEEGVKFCLRDSTASVHLWKIRGSLQVQARGGVLSERKMCKCDLQFVSMVDKGLLLTKICVIYI